MAKRVYLSEGSRKNETQKEVPPKRKKKGGGGGGGRENKVVVNNKFEPPPGCRVSLPLGGGVFSQPAAVGHCSLPSLESCRLPSSASRLRLPHPP